MLILLSLFVWAGFFYGAYAFIKNKRGRSNFQSESFSRSSREAEFDYDEYRQKRKMPPTIDQ
jgi:hypothetical protein